MMFKITLFILVLMVVAACKGGGGESPTSPTPPPEPIPTGATYNVSGKVTYDFVPIASPGGLNYSSSAVLKKPVRNVIIQARRPSDNAIVATSSTDDSGNFVLAIPQALTTYYVGVLSQMTSPAITVEDNTTGNSVYLAQSGTKNNTGDLTIPDVHIPSGWVGTNATGSYGATRFSAPFAILDTIYTAHKKMLAARGDFTLPLLKVNWSKNNVSSSSYNPSTGAIGTSHFDGTELYILGKADNDTDEFDQHVIVHEWGHFVEAKISRSDSLGGQHSSNDKLNMSVAFGEGWGNALSAIILDPGITYLDSMSTRQHVIGVEMNLESGNDTNPGWFSEASVQQLLFDIYDPANEAADTLNLGLGTMIDVLRGPQKLTSSVTSIFSFMDGLKSLNGGSSAAIDNLVAAKSISPIANEYGTGETNNGGVADSLPVYRSLANNTPITVSLGGRSFRYNQLQNTRYFRFTATTTKARVSLNCSDYCIIAVYKEGDGLGEMETPSALKIQDLNTTAGDEYIILLTTFPEETVTTGSITSTLKVQAI